MTAPESQAPDAPFPGAHSQVPGVRHNADERAPQGPGMRHNADERAPHGSGPRPLPLQMTAGEAEDRQPGWGVRLPVRAEHVRVQKTAVVYERVYVRRREIDDVVRLDGTVRREELRVEVDRPTRTP